MASPAAQETANVPYGIVWDAWKRGQVVPFLGAGASFVGRVPGEKFNPKDPKFLPSGWDLSCYLAAASSFPGKEDWEKGDLAKVCSYYVEVQSDRGDLRDHLRNLLNREQYKPGSLHHFIASIPSPQVIVVTNYDTLVEQAFLEAGKPYDLVVYPADQPDFGNALLWWPHGATEPTPLEANKFDIDLAKTTVIYKMHGTISKNQKWDNFVITEEDYVEFLSRMTRSAAVPSSFIEYFRSRRFLFLGYSLRDWNLRVVLNSLKRGTAASQDKSNRSWSVQLNPSELERTLWKSKNVTIYDLPLDQFTAEIQRQAMGE